MRFFSWLPRRIYNVAPMLPQWAGQYGMAPQNEYTRSARAYMSNEIVFAAIEMLSTSAAEPHIVGRRFRRESPAIRNERRRLVARGVPPLDVHDRLVENGYYEDIPRHPAVRLANNPNPIMSRGQFWGTVVMDRCLAGNSYALKARYQSGPVNGAVAELWRLRPDRVRVIPSGKGIEAYEYNTGREKILYPPEDIVHFKTRHPLNDYYGMPPLMAVMGRVDIDEYMRTFLRTFYERGGTGPGAVLSVKQKLSQEAKDEARERFKKQFGGASGFHELMIIDNNEHTYTQMGLNRGMRDALPKEIDNVTEARIAMAFGIPGSILGLLIGYESSSYANKRQDWQVFWDLTMTPLMSDLDDTLNRQLVPDFGGVDELVFDLSDIRALQEDVDAIHKRHRDNLVAGIESWQEAREAIGLNPEPKEGIFFVPSTVVATDLDRLGEEPEIPEPRQEEMQMVAEVRHACGKKIAEDVQGNPELWCWVCKEAFRPHDEKPRVVVKTVERDQEGRVARVLEVVS